MLPNVGAPNDAGSDGAMMLKEVVKGDGGQLDKLPNIWGMRGENGYKVVGQDKALKYSVNTAGSGACGKICNLCMWVVVDVPPDLRSQEEAE